MDIQSEKLLAQIIRNTRVASLGTLRDEATLVSMVAYISAQDFSAFYIFISRLAQYTIDMQKDKRMSLLIAQTDDGLSNPESFARITIRGTAEMMEIGEPGYTPAKKQYIERFPESAVLFKLEDFGLWRIKPKGGRYVIGLAKAFNITPETLMKVSAR
jgi:putative heme iron utilization protein